MDTPYSTDGGCNSSALLSIGVATFIMAACINNCTRVKSTDERIDHTYIDQGELELCAGCEQNRATVGRFIDRPSLEDL